MVSSHRAEHISEGGVCALIYVEAVIAVVAQLPDREEPTGGFTGVGGREARTLRALRSVATLMLAPSIVLLAVISIPTSGVVQRDRTA